LEFFGVTSDEMKGDRWQMLMHPGDAEAYTSEFIACVRDQRPFCAQTRVRRADGKWRWIESWGRPRLSSSNEFLGYIGASADITDNKRDKDELRLLNKTLEQQVAERTRLAQARSKQLLRLAVELIEAEELERKRFAQFLHDDLQQMLASAKIQLQIISTSSADTDTLVAVNHILEESIAKSRSLSHELSPAILHRSGLEAALRWLSDKMYEQFGLKVEFLGTTKKMIKSSTIAIFMFRSAQELLFNIVKHADVKNANLALSSSDDSISLTVSDQGKGFDTKSVDLLTGNVGFGIMTIRERASHIGGSLTIDSAPGKGSRFTLQIPLQLVLSPDVQNVVPEAQQRTPTEWVTSSAATGIRVLFADDHKVMRQGLIRLISSQPGIAVAGEAANGREAVELARQLHPDVILMDISMPEMDGIEATRCIKAELPEVRVIGLSMFEDKNSAQNIINAGADSFVPKTASSAELLKKIYESCE
jgi:PAS domain S-box-containing protein